MNFTVPLKGLTLTLLLAFCIGASGQTPSLLNYQAVMRDAAGEPLSNQAVSIRFTIAETSVTGPLRYQEIHNLTTAETGLVSLKIGNGALLFGSITNIDWAGHAHFLVVDLDPNGGNAFSYVGNQQLVSVPYALHAKTVELETGPELDGTGSSSDPLVLNQQGAIFGEVLKWNGSSWVPKPDKNDSLIWFKNGADAYYDTGKVGIGTIPIEDFHVGAGKNVLIGADTVGIGNKLLYYSDLGAFRAGGLTSFHGAMWDRDSIGQYSFASGRSTRATGLISTAIGSETVARGTRSFASGYGSQASGLTSTAMGHYSKASAPHSVAIGVQAYAESYNSVAFGAFNVGGGSASGWLGTDPLFEIGNGLNYLARSNAFTILKNGSVGVGTDDPKTEFHVTEDRSVLFGEDVTGEGTKLLFDSNSGTFRVGSVDVASSTYWDPDSLGYTSFASGVNTLATEYGSTAMGIASESKGQGAFAAGYGPQALGFSSVGLGRNSIAGASMSCAIGRELKVDAYAGSAMGSYNEGGGDPSTWIPTDPLFEIGNGTSSVARNNAMTILKNGNVGIGTTFPASALHVDGEIQLGSFEKISDGGGALIAFNSTLIPVSDGGSLLGISSKRWSAVYALNGTINTSDRRDKRNITKLNYGLDEVMKIDPVRFEWKDRPEDGVKIGLIAQDLQKVLPEVVVDTEWVTNEETGEKTEVPAERLGVYYSDIIPVLIKGMQEQQLLIQNQSELIETQQKEIGEMNVLLQTLIVGNKCSAHYPNPNLK